MEKPRAREKAPLQKKKPFWMTRAMAEDFDRDDVLYTTFREAIIYAAFFLAISISTIGRRSISMYYITKGIADKFLGELSDGKEHRTRPFENDIKTPTDFWKYCETTLMESLYWEHYYDPYEPIAPASRDDQKILSENLLLGVPRIRQVKIRNDSCMVHEYFRRFFHVCFGMYDEDDEDKDSFGKRKGTAWTYNSPEKSKSIDYSGVVASYGGGGFYQDLGDDREESLQIIQDLKDNLWITTGTRAIFISFSVYNANLNLFVVSKLIFEFPPTGGIVTSADLQALHLIQFMEVWDYVTYSCEMIIYALMVFYTCEEFREIIYFKFKYFLQFWAYMDLINIALAYANMMTSLIVFPNVDDAIKRIENHPHNYGNLEYLANRRTFYNNFAAALMFFSYVKIFKYLSFNKTMGQLNNTLKMCAWDIAGFAVMFFIIFFAFAALGFLLFGSEAEDYRSFGYAMLSLLRTILGDFEYKPIEEAQMTIAPIYFLSYIFFVFFVLLNIFLAIINDTYGDVKNEIAIGPDEMQMAEFLKNGFYHLINKLGCGCFKWCAKNKARDEILQTIRNVREALTKCGFSSSEIEKFFARYNIKPDLDISDYNMPKLMKDVEEHTTADGLTSDEDRIRIDDFVQQERRLVAIEASVGRLVQKTFTVIRKLEIIENLKKPIR